MYTYEAKVVDSMNEDNCPFCNKYKQDVEVIYENDSFFVMPNIYPYTKNHILLMPKRHVHSELEFTKDEVTSFLEIHAHILKTYYDQFNSCFHFQRENTPGQTQWHWHRHYVPDEMTIIPKAPRVPFEGLEFTL